MKTTPAWRPPILCLVTDRLALAALIGVPRESAAEALVRQVERAVAAGVDLVQVRERDMEGGALAALVGRLLTVAVPGRTRVVVNDRLDVALAAGADGVHLRGDSLPTLRVRGLVPPGFLVGRSVRNADEARREGERGADYTVLGTVFPTPSKPGDPVLAGAAELTRAAAASRVPVLGIGGITEARLGDAAATGAAGVAAIRLFWRPDLDAAGYRDAVAGWRRAFDLARPIT